MVLKNSWVREKEWHSCLWRRNIAHGKEKMSNCCMHYIKLTKLSQRPEKWEKCIFWKAQFPSGYVQCRIYYGFDPHLSVIFLISTFCFMLRTTCCSQGVQTWPISDPRRQQGFFCLCPGACWALGTARLLSLWLFHHRQPLCYFSCHHKFVIFLFVWVWASPLQH